MMKSITFTCEVITPMFLAGADPMGMPELRPPSIKGALRFWWRALNGDKPNMKELETKIFGGVGDTLTMRSSFTIQNIKMPTNNDFKHDLWNEIEHTFQGKSKIPTPNSRGTAYLLYSTFMLNSRKYIIPRCAFAFKISFLKSEYLEHIIKALNALVIFGALGTRSRRGGGSFWVKNLICNEDLKDREEEFQKVFCNKNLKTIETLQDYLVDNFNLNNHSINNYSHLKGAKIYLFDIKSDWKQALEIIGRPFFEYRSKYSVVSDVGGTPNFGFPILHRKKENRPSITMQAGKTGEFRKKEDLLERRSSPLIFKLIQVDENVIFPVIIWLSGELIPSNFQIMDKSGANNKAPASALLTDFFETELARKTPNLIL